MPSSYNTPRSINRLLGLFYEIAESTSGMSLAQLSEALDSPKSSLLNLLRPLVEQKYLFHENHVYILGPRAFQFASAILSNSRFSTLIREFMIELRDKCEETVIYATINRESDLIYYSDVVESLKEIRYSVPAGVNRPIYCSAAGRLLLAYQDREWQEAYLARTELVPITPLTITDPDILRQRLTEIKEEGISFSIGEAVEGAAGVAAPVFQSNGIIAGALLVGAPSDRAAKMRESLQRWVRETAEDASRAFGHLR